VVSFRLSEKALTNLEDYAKKVTKQNRNRTLNTILENLFEPQRSEQPKEDARGFLEAPSSLYCPLAKGWIKKEDLIGQTGNCSDCTEKPKCSAWRIGDTFQLPRNKSRNFLRKTLAKSDSGGVYW